MVLKTLLNREMLVASIEAGGGMRGDPSLQYANRILMNLEKNSRTRSYENGKFRIMIGAWQWIEDDWQKLTNQEKEIAVKLITWMVGGYPWSRAELDFSESVAYLNLYM